MVCVKAFKEKRVYTKAFKKEKIYIRASGKIINFKGLIKSPNIIILEFSISYTDGFPPSDEKRKRLVAESLKNIVLTTLKIFS